MHLTPLQERYGDMLVKDPVGVVIDEWDFRSQQRYKWSVAGTNLHGHHAVV